MFNPQTAPDNLVASVSRNRGERATGSFNAPATRTLYYAKHFFKITPTFEKVKSREREANNSAHIYSISHRLAPAAKKRDKGLNQFFGRKIMRILQWWKKWLKNVQKLQFSLIFVLSSDLKSDWIYPSVFFQWSSWIPGILNSVFGIPKHAIAGTR